MASEIKANPEMLRIVARLGKVVDSLPAVFPTPASPLVRPLAIGVGRYLHDHVTPPDGMASAKAHAIIADSLRRYVQSGEYLQALAAPGAMRHDIDGAPVEPVSQDHAEFASRQPSTLTKETINVLVPAIKVTLPLRPDQLPAIGDTVKTLDVAIDLGDGRPFRVPFSGKNYRRALRQVDDLTAGGGEVVVLLQGRLVAGHRIEGAGLSVQARAPKVEA
jgi:hypothetical protein